ncbi:MAG: glycoside hydrolase family 13 protein [Ruminococcaceae bacterium]|nr:glycoside hydrolase family 13 protein [Oscillospiraceae bacterium]
MDFIPYNSRLSYHKTPFGAVREGEKVTIRIVLPRSICCTGASLILNSDSGKSSVYPMIWERLEGNAEEWWKVSFIPEEQGLYWYHFAIAQKSGGVLITRFDGSTGRLSSDGKSFQLTVYSKDFKTPDWVKGSVIYQIFPDRFCNSGEEKSDVPDDRVLRSDWGNEPMWNPDGDGKINKYDFFGGDFKGIEQKLDYIKSLGVGCIYLNPIFEAQSNHRYDTANYEKTDPLLGSEKDFSHLCKEAEKRNIKIVLDGVFSHTGADSIYFNKENRYDSVGAYNSEESPYHEWYKFEEFPDKYSCWWGVDILPEIDEENDGYIEYIAGENGILRKWLKAGASGWRLDVADELPDKFLDELRKAVRTEKEDAYILGEVWEDASNKISYSQRRRYLLGAQLDSVMNYPFADALINFAISGIAEGFNDRISEVCENYPKPAVDCLMNHIGTHDTCRVLSRLATGGNYHSSHLDRYRGGLTDEQKEFGKILLKLISTMQFTLPGVPCIYYSDEAGVDGGEDPFNRGCFPWDKEDKELIEHYRFLGRLRSEHRVFEQGDFVPVSAALGCVAYERRNEKERIMTVANRNSHHIVYTLPEEGFTALTGGVVSGRELYLEGNTAAILIKVSD